MKLADVVMNNNLAYLVPARQLPETARDRRDEESL